MTINGHHFGSNSSYIVVSIDDINAAVVESTNTYITVDVPPVVGSSLLVEIDVDGNVFIYFGRGCISIKISLWFFL